MNTSHTLSRTMQTSFAIFAVSALALLGAFLFAHSANAAALTGVSVTSVTWATDNLIGQSSAKWRFSMTNPTALYGGDVVQVTFPDSLSGAPFQFQSVTLSATSGGVWLATTVVAVNNRTLAFVTTSSVAPAVATNTAFTITVDGVTNATGDRMQLADMVWQLRTGTPQNVADPAGPLSTVKDGPTNFTQSLIRRGFGVVSDASSGIVLSSYGAGATNVSYTFTFTATSIVPDGGKIVLNFPSEYNLTNATTTPSTDINGTGAGSPSVSSGAVAIVNTGGRNLVRLAISNAATNAGDTLTVVVANITNPSTANVYRPFYVYTTTPQNGLIDGGYNGPFEDFYNGPPPVDTIHIGGTNHIIVTAKKNPGVGTVLLDATERPQVEVGLGCPDKMFFVGTRNLTSTSSATFSNLLNCNYILFTMPSSSTGTASFAFWDSFLQPSFKEVLTSGNSVISIDMIFLVPDTTLIGEIRGGAANYGSGEIMAFNDTHMAWDTLWTSPAYATEGLSSTGTGYFSLRVRGGSTWQMQVPNPWNGTMASGANEYWPPSIPPVVVTTTGTKNIGFYTYTLADKLLNVIVRNASTNAVITDACVGVKRSGGGIFMGSQNMICFPNNNNNTSYQFKVPEGSLAIEIMKPGVGRPEDYPVAVNTAAVTSTILISAPTSYIKAVVRDSDLRPISGAPVFVQSSSGYGQAVTDGTGTATTYVPFGTYRVEGFAPELGPLTAQTGVVVDSGVNPTVTFTVDTSAFRSITGRVFIDVNSNNAYNDGTDTPLEGIQVGARGTGSTSGGNGAVTLTDGTYTLRVPSGTYSVGGWSSKYGGFPEQSVNVSAGNAAGINFAVAESGTLEITVVGGADISPLFAGAFNPTTGRGNGTDEWTVSSTNKFTSLTLPAGTYELHIGAPAFGELTQAGGATISVLANTISATSYNVTAVATLVTLSGTVTDSVATPLANVNVWASRINGPGGFSTLTASDGTYSLKVPDTFTYEVGAQRGGYLASSLELAMSGNRTQNFVLATAGLTITGSVLGTGSAGVAGAWVWADKTATSIWSGAQTDASGAYSLEVDGGTWTVYAEGPCYLRSTGLAATAGDSGKNITLSAISGCSAPVPQLQSLTPASGGIVTNGTDATVNIPANALGTGSDAVTVSVVDADIIPTSPNMTMLAGGVQTISAVNSSGQAITNLNANAEITLSYSEASLPVGLDENNLQVAYWDTTNEKWEPVAGTVDPDQNTITLQLDHFTDVGVGGPGVPAAPQNVVATAISGTQINLTWNAVSGATSYKVYRSTASGSGFGNYYTVTTTSKNDTALSPNIRYYYKITAVNSSGESAYSSEANALTSASGGGGGGGGGSSPPLPATTQTVQPTATSTTTAVTPTVTTAPTAPQTTVRLAGTLIRYADNPKVYVLEEGKKRWIETAEDFVKLGFDWTKIVIVPTSETYADGEVKKLTRGQITQLFVRNLARGSRGPEVKALQEKLKALGFFPAHLKTTEFFGPVTDKAVKAFQKSRGIRQVGTVGPVTRKALNAL